MFYRIYLKSESETGKNSYVAVPENAGGNNTVPIYRGGGMALYRVPLL